MAYRTRFDRSDYLYLEDRMSNYPDKYPWRSDKDHLLFDIGYGYALLRRCQDYLSFVAETFEDSSAGDLVDEIKALQKYRMQTTREVYDAADKLFEELGNGLDKEPIDPRGHQGNERQG